MPRPVIWENFDSYSNGDSISGKSGGSGWDSNWAIDNGTVTVSNEQARSGGLSLKFGATGGDVAHRDLTINNNDQVDLWFYAPYTKNALGIIEFRTSGGVWRFGARFNYLDAGRICVEDNGWKDAGSFVENAWNKLSFILNASNNKMDLYINDKLAYRNAAGVNSGSLIRLHLETGSAQANVMYFDSIQI